VEGARGRSVVDEEGCS